MAGLYGGEFNARDQVRQQIHGASIQEVFIISLHIDVSVAIYVQ